MAERLQRGTGHAVVTSEPAQHITNRRSLNLAVAIAQEHDRQSLACVARICVVELAARGHRREVERLKRLAERFL